MTPTLPLQGEGEQSHVSQTATDPLVGTTVVQYEILAKLGGGGMGIVYSARDTRLERRVALKFLPPQWSHDESAKQRFMLEARAASATNHRNICTIHDFGTADDGRLFIVMAQYDGPTLKQRLEQGPLAVDEAIDTAAQVAEGLARAHAQGVVHRDIKPGNLILAEDGVRIVDFGLARLAGSQQLTLEGSTLGTVAYMSPEQSRGDDADARSDIWSIGIVIFEMLTGSLPFKGGYPEAISHAIRTSPTPALRLPGGEPANALERVVRRALEKDPTQRYQSARELARDLRLLQGRTVPLDLMTGPVQPLYHAGGARPSRRRLPRYALFATLAVAAIAAAVAWVLMPVERVPIVIAPVVNQTGYAELEPYRMALTQELISELADSSVVRVLPYERVLQAVRRYRNEGDDVSSRDALAAVTAVARPAIIVIPTLLYEAGAWHGRLEFRDPRTALSENTIESPPMVSSLIKETSYRLMPMLAAAIDNRYIEAGPMRRRIALSTRRLVSGNVPLLATRMASLDAAASFERGIESFEQLEYSAALQAFTSAADTDARNPVPWIWRSRTAWLMRQDRLAVEAADTAARLLTPDTPPYVAALARGVSAEARRDAGMADTAYRQLAAMRPDEWRPLMELAGFQDRQVRNRDAIQTYQAVLALDDTLIRPRLELCRLYNRVNEPAAAREQADRVLRSARALGDWALETQASFCLVDVLRVGSPSDRAQARQYADGAVKTLMARSGNYQLSRGYYYLGLAAAAVGDLPQVVANSERAADIAKREGNLLLEPLVLMNIGAAQERLGNRLRASEFYDESSKAYERLGEEARAAQIQANRGALLIEYGDNPDEGRRNLDNALAVVRKLGDKNFEVFCLQVIAANERNNGRHAEAIRTLNQALAIARERDLKDEIASLTIDIARSRYDLGDYAAARQLLTEALRDESGSRIPEARLRLAMTLSRLGDAGAPDELQRASLLIAQAPPDPTLVALKHLAAGQLALAAGRLPDAHREFSEASQLWVDTQPDAAAVEARIYMGLVSLKQGRYDDARTALEAGLKKAASMRRYALEVRARVYLADWCLAMNRSTEALEMLKPIQPDDRQAAGPELQAAIQQRRAEATKRLGSAAALFHLFRGEA